MSSLGLWTCDTRRCQCCKPCCAWYTFLINAGAHAEAPITLAALQVTAASPSFEEVALKFVDVEDLLALQAFLQAKLASLGKGDKAQVRRLMAGVRPAAFSS